MLALDIGRDGRERSNRITAATTAIAIKEPQIGRQLYRLFRAAGLDDVKVEIYAGADTAGRSMPMLKASFARYARDSGKIAAVEVEGWFADIDRAVASGSFLF